MKKRIENLIKKIQYLIYSFTLKGKVVHCRMCDWHGKRFVDKRCPKCNSLPRTRLVPFSLDYFDVKLNQKKVLHVAPNVSEYQYFNEFYDIAVYDRLNINPDKHINLIQDLTQTNIESGFYDTIVIWHVLEHIPNDLDAIKELYRILNKDGKLIVSVPIYPVFNPTTKEDPNLDRSKFEEVHGHHDHCRSCGLDYFERFEKYNFKTHTLNSKDINELDRLKYGLSETHTVWCFTK